MSKNTTIAKQLSFSQAEYETKKRLTRRDLFLAKMGSVVPWSRLIAVIEPHYPKSNVSNQTVGLNSEAHWIVSIADGLEPGISFAINVNPRQWNASRRG